MKKPKKIPGIKRVSADYRKIFQRKRQLNKLKKDILFISDRYCLLKADQNMPDNVQELLEDLDESDRKKIERIKKNIQDDLNKNYPIESKDQFKKKKKRYEYSPYMVR